MKIVFLGNNRVALELVKWLRLQDNEIVALVLHPLEKSKYRNEIIEASGVDAAKIFDGGTLRDEAVLKEISSLKPDIGVSAFFGYILKKEFLDILPQGCINIHPSYLPFNKGSYPNVWSIIDGTPAGVTMHYIDEGIDTGKIISQSRVDVLDTDTGGSLHRKLEERSIELFMETWPKIENGTASVVDQIKDAGTHHDLIDVETVDEIDLEKKYKAKELIDIIRARTFSPYKGAFYRNGSKKIYLRLDLSSEKESDK